MMDNDGLHHLKVEYWLDSSGRDITYTADIVVLPEDYDMDTFRRIISVKEYSNNDWLDLIHIASVRDADGRVTTRDFSLALGNGLNGENPGLPPIEELTSDGDFNQPPLGDLDKFTVYLEGGTAFDVTIERRRQKWC